MPYSDISWAYKDPLTIQNLNQMDDNSVWTSEHRIVGCELATTGTSTVEIMPGRLEIAGLWLQETTTANLVLTAENNAHWEGANGELSSTSMYIVAYNSAGSTFSVKFRASGPAYSDTASATAGFKRYDKTGTTWYRYIGAVWNNSGSAITPQRQRGNKTFLYQLNTAVGADDDTGTLVVLYKVSAVAFTTATVSQLAFVEAIPTFYQTNIGNNVDFKPADVTGVGQKFGDTSEGRTFSMPLNTSKEIAYKSDAATVQQFTTWITGYEWRRGD